MIRAKYLSLDCLIIFDYVQLHHELFQKVCLTHLLTNLSGQRFPEPSRIYLTLSNNKFKSFMPKMNKTGRKNGLKEFEQKEQKKQQNYLVWVISIKARD